MEPNAILTADPLDLLFDQRNKNYGAYTLRKNYERRMLIALGLSLSAGLILFWALFSGPAPLMTTQVMIPGDNIIGPPPITPVVKPPVVTVPHHTVHAASLSNTAYRIVPDERADKQIHTVEELDKGHLGVTEVAGPPETGIVPAGSSTVPGGTGEAPAKETVPEVYRVADVMPQFPGGEQALLRFLNRNLRMPDGAEAGTKVSVRCTFIVGTDGKVRQAEIGKSGGARFDDEVKRVIARMPAWIPGRMGDRSVAVYFTLPVQFLVPEE